MAKHRSRKTKARKIMGQTGMPFSKAARLADAGGVSPIRAEWTTSGWHRLLPVETWALEMIIGTATVDQVDGTLDELVAKHLAGPDWFPRGSDTELGAVVPEPGRPDDAHAREGAAAFRFALAQLEAEVPATVGELAELLARVGVYHHTCGTDGVHRWRGEELPHVLDVLVLPEQWQDKENEARWRTTTGRAAGQLLDVLAAHKLSGASTTTLDRLAVDTTIPADHVRLGVEGLVHRGVLVVDQRGVQLDAGGVRRLAGHDRIALRVDWDQIDQDEEEGDGIPEQMVWSDSPWAVYRGISMTADVGPDLLETVAVLPFTRSTPDGQMSRTNLAELAAEQAAPVARVIDSLVNLEALGYLIWNAGKQRAEVRHLPASRN